MEALGGAPDASASDPSTWSIYGKLCGSILNFLKTLPSEPHKLTFSLSAHGPQRSRVGAKGSVYRAPPSTVAPRTAPPPAPKRRRRSGYGVEPTAVQPKAPFRRRVVQLDAIVQVEGQVSPILCLSGKGGVRCSQPVVGNWTFGMCAAHWMATPLSQGPVRVALYELLAHVAKTLQEAGIEWVLTGQAAVGADLFKGLLPWAQHVNVLADMTPEQKLACFGGETLARDGASVTIRQWLLAEERREVSFGNFAVFVCGPVACPPQVLLTTNVLDGQSSSIEILADDLSVYGPLCAPPPSSCVRSAVYASMDCEVLMNRISDDVSRRLYATSKAVFKMVPMPATSNTYATTEYVLPALLTLPLSTVRLNYVYGVGRPTRALAPGDEPSPRILCSLCDASGSLAAWAIVEWLRIVPSERAPVRPSREWDLKIWHLQGAAVSEVYVCYVDVLSSRADAGRAGSALIQALAGTAARFVTPTRAAWVVLEALSLPLASEYARMDTGVGRPLVPVDPGEPLLMHVALEAADAWGEALDVHTPAPRGIAMTYSGYPRMDMIFKPYEKIEAKFRKVAAAAVLAPSEDAFTVQVAEIVGLAVAYQDAAAQQLSAAYPECYPLQRATVSLLGDDEKSYERKFRRALNVARAWALESSSSFLFSLDAVCRPASSEHPVFKMARSHYITHYADALKDFRWTLGQANRKYKCREEPLPLH